MKDKRIEISKKISEAIKAVHGSGVSWTIIEKVMDHLANEHSLYEVAGMLNEFQL